MKKKNKIIIRRIVFVVIILIVCNFVVSHYDSKEYTIDNPYEFIRKVCKMTKNKAVAVGVMDDDEDLYLEYSDLEDVNVDKHTLFELGSTTKAFTGLGILKLEAEGRIDINDSVTDYISWFRPQYNGSDAVITICQLMNHSSGIPVWSISLIPEGGENETSLEETIREISDIKLKHAPGEVHEYATINYDILALIIEEVTGQKYEDYMMDNILGEVGMSESFFRVNDSDPERMIPGRKNGFLKTWRYHAPTYYGNTAAGYLVSNTNDLVKWLRYVKKNIPFDSFPITDSNHYFAGWNLYPEKVCHGGNNPNYGSQIILSKNKDFGVFALSASAGDVATKIANGIFRMHMGEKITIGLCFSDQELLDCVFTTGVLALLYIMLLLKHIHKGLCLCSGIFILAGIALFPVIFHISCRFLFVWMPFSFPVFLVSLFVMAVTGVIAGIRN